MDIENILISKQNLIYYLTLECGYKIQTAYTDSEFPQATFLDIGDKRLLVIQECINETEIREARNHFLTDKGLSHGAFIAKGKIIFYRSYGERKYFAYSMTSRKNSSKVDKLRKISDDFDVLFQFRDISADFYEAFKLKRDILARSIENVIEDIKKYLLAQKIFDRIFFIYFLCHKKIIKLTDGQSVQGRILFNILLDNGDFLENMYAMFNYFNTLDETNLEIGPFSISIPYLNGGLFRQEEEECDLKISLKKHDWRQIFDFLNSYHWIIEEDVEEIEDDEKVLTPEILGHVYERSVIEWERKGFDKEVDEALGKTERESLGVYYTPEYITDYICSNTIYQFLLDQFGKKYYETDELLEKGTKHDFERALEILERITVLDPACGSGAFLIKAADIIFRLKSNILDKLGKKSSHYKAKLDIIVNNIFGVDILAGAVEIARLRLWLWLVSSYKEEHDIQALPNIEYNLREGNSLVGWVDEVISPSLSSPLNREVNNLFKGMMVYTTENERTELEKARNLLRGYDNGYDEKVTMQNYAEAYHILKRIYRRAYGRAANNLKQIIEEIRNSIYNSINISLLGYINDKIEPRWRHRKPLIPPINIGQLGKLKPFHWKVDFYAERFGFDIVIGNPPYLRIQGLHEHHELTTKFYEKQYASATGRYDFYVLFIERGTKLLKSNGYLGFIVPHKFTNSLFGKGIRGYLAYKKLIFSFLSFGHHFVFEVTTYTGILIVKNSANFTFFYKEIGKLKSSSIGSELAISKYDDFAVIDESTLGQDPWMLRSGSTFNILMKIANSGPAILEYFDKILQGIITGDDAIYFLRTVKDNGKTMILFSKKLGRTIELEKDMINPIILGEDVKKYKFFDELNYYVLYPYIVQNSSQRVLEENELQSMYPLTYSYLSQFKDHLIALKKNFKTNPKYWYALHRPRKKEWFDQERIITPQITFGCNMTLDKEKLFHNAKVYSFLKKGSVKQDVRYFLAVLNSELMWFFLKNTGYVLRGGYFTFTTEYLKPFHIPQLTSKKIEDEFIQKVDLILGLNREMYRRYRRFQNELESCTTQIKISDGFEKSFDLSFESFIKKINKNAYGDIEKDSKLKDYFNEYRADLVELMYKIKKLDSELNHLVFQLYHLDEDEIKVIEENNQK